MNCKKGDLAVIVYSSNTENIGKLVTCISRHDGPWFQGSEPGWRIDKQIKVFYPDGTPNVQCFISDSALRPIRDQPGADETLSWKDVPQEVQA